MNLPTNLLFDPDYKYSSRVFTWDKDTFGNWHGTSEASDLGLSPGEEPHGDLYTNQPGLGFIVTNPVTRGVKAFEHVLTHRDEGDIVFWEYLSTDEKITIRIRND